MKNQQVSTFSGDVVQRLSQSQGYICSSVSKHAVLLWSWHWPGKCAPATRRKWFLFCKRTADIHFWAEMQLSSILLSKLMFWLLWVKCIYLVVWGRITDTWTTQTETELKPRHKHSTLTQTETELKDTHYLGVIWLTTTKHEGHPFSKSLSFRSDHWLEWQWQWQPYLRTD